MDTLWEAESGLVWSQLVPGAPLTKEIGVHVFYRCQCTTVETVRELTEFAKSIPGFVDLFLNDQVSCYVFLHDMQMVAGRFIFMGMTCTLPNLPDKPVVVILMLPALCF